MEDRAAKKKKIISYLISGAVLLSAIGGCLWWENPFDAVGAKNVIIDICNAFTVPGVWFLGASVLTYLSKLGAYDSFGYTFSNFSLHNLWFTKQPKKYKSFYDYKVAKDEKGRAWWPEGLWLGLGTLTVSGILLIVYFIL